MKVNCVIVTYNRLALLKECLAAIEKQTYPNMSNRMSVTSL